MATIEERATRLEADVENEQEWRRELAKEMRDGFARLEAKIDTNQRWLTGIVLASVSIAVAVIKFL